MPLLILFFIMIKTSFASSLPAGFVYLEDVAPEIKQSVRYFSNENFIGKRIKGYGAGRIILTKEAALTLKKVNEEMQKEGFTLVVYDGYRPQTAVDEFVSWGKSEETSKKNYYYPEISKKDIFKRGFVATKSGHSRGSTVDLTIIKNGKNVTPVKAINRGKFTFLDDGTVDMGMHFDFFGTESWAQSPLISEEFNKRRKFLQEKMVKHGFKVFEGEWWHFTLAKEPFPETYFDFPIK
jgi:D-alanyl-D-alanine dipeptidase